MSVAWNSSISIIVPNLNGRDMLEHCLNAVFNLDYPKSLIEVIVVDNASIDGSTYFLSRHYPKVRIIQSDTNVGFAQAINLAAEQAEGTYLFLLNNDAAPDPDCIKQLLSPILAGECECTSAQIVNEDRSTIHFSGGGMNFHGIAFQTKEGEAYLPAAANTPSQPVLFACGAAMLISSKLFKQTGGMDADFFAYFEDVDFGWRLWILGHRVHYVPTAVVTHKQSSTSRFIWLPKLRVLHIRNPLMMIYKNYEQGFLNAVLPVALMLTAQRSRRLTDWPEDRFAINNETQLADTHLSIVQPTIVQPSIAQKRDANADNEPLTLPPLAASDFIALNNWVDNFEGLNKKREALQSARVHSDAELLNLFVDPFRYAEQDAEYQRLQNSFVTAFGINELFCKASQA